MTKRRLHAGLVVAAVGTILAAAAAASVGFGWRGEPAAQSSPEPFLTTTVKRETLVDYIIADGQLGFGEGLPLASRATGTVTWLPAGGSTIGRGDTLFRIDDLPVLLLFGPLPMYRPLSIGTNGADVAQFERNLQALGYDGFTVDQNFSASTATAVKSWQRDLGLPESGAVEPDRIAYAPGPVRVEHHLVRVGAAAPADIIAITGTVKVVTVNVPAADAGWAVAGAPASITLTDGATVAGKVSTVEAASTEGSDGTPQTRITIAVADQKTLATVDRGTVVVRHAVAERKDVLTVPIAALLALAEGGYGLEIVDGGVSRTVAVQVGMFAAGRVEVTGADVRAGTTVRMPR